MARNESDREDLIAEATALVRRVEFEVPAAGDSVVAGYRGDGSFSIYLGSDPVYHFDGAGHLRRAFVDGKLYRTQGDTLAQLTRQRDETAVTLLRHDLSPAELDGFFEAMTSALKTVHQSLDAKTATVTRQIPDNERVIDRVQSTLAQLSQTQPDLAPRLPGKR